MSKLRPNKFQKEVFSRVKKENGISLSLASGGKHPKVLAPCGSVINIISSSPSCPKSADNWMAQNKDRIEELTSNPKVSKPIVVDKVKYFKSDPNFCKPEEPKMDNALSPVEKKILDCEAQLLQEFVLEKMGTDRGSLQKMIVDSGWLEDFTSFRLDYAAKPTGPAPVKIRDKADLIRCVKFLYFHNDESFTSVARIMGMNVPVVRSYILEESKVSKNHPVDLDWILNLDQKDAKLLDVRHPVTEPTAQSILAVYDRKRSARLARGA